MRQPALSTQFGKEVGFFSCRLDVEKEPLTDICFSLFFSLLPSQCKQCGFLKNKSMMRARKV